MRRRSVTVAMGLAAAGLVAPRAAGAAPPSSSGDPLAPPHWLGRVPSPGSVLGFPLGQRPVTAAESDRYLLAVAAASPRVSAGVYGTSWEGRQLRYAVVGRPDRLGPDTLERIAAHATQLRDPLLPAARERMIVADTPAIVWLVAGQHNNEVSGVDAALRVLYALSDRDDCAALRILDEALVVIVPDASPDSRDAADRFNHYRFNLNLDWLMRTQPETDRLLELIRHFPPVLLLDLHEMPRGGYFFPPSDDPYFHEIPQRVVDWQTTLYGPAAADAFRRRGVPFTPYRFPYQFGPWMSSTAISVGYLGVGATLEKTFGDPLPQKIDEHELAVWSLVHAAASNRRQILTGWHESYVDAYREGLAGRLAPNHIVNPANHLDRPVPQRTVRHYFLLDTPGRRDALHRVVRRLQRMDVTVYRTTAPLAVPDYHPYGRAARAVTLPAGTCWIPLAQGQKHWIEAALNESTYNPVHTLNDQLRGWSMPLAAGVDGGWSGAPLRPAARPAAPLDEPPPPHLPVRPPRIAVLDDTADIVTNGGWESAGWLRYQLDQRWRLPYRMLTGAQVAAGALHDTHVLIAPATGPTIDDQLGAAGAAALTAFVHGGGHFVGWRGGAMLATRLGLTTTSITAEDEDFINGLGGLMRVRLDPDSPLTAGLGPFAWVADGPDTFLMHAADPAWVVAAYPPTDSEDFFVSGYIPRADRFAGTAAVVREPVGTGSTTLFSIDPNFYGWTEGTSAIVLNTLLAPGA